MSRKRLTFKQIEKKSILLDQTKKNIKGHNRKEINKIWEKYRTKKYIIEELPKYRKKLANAKPEQKVILRERYYDKKEIAQRKLYLNSLQVEKRVRQTFSEQDYYKLRKGNIDNAIDKIFNNPKVRYVLVTLKIKLKDTDNIIFVSDSFTPEAWEQLQESETTAMEKILEKLSFVAKYDGFELISKHIRIIYALPEKAVRQQKHRKNKR